MLTDPFHYQQGKLYCDGVDLESAVAVHGTPSYIYSLDAILTRYRAYETALEGLHHQVHFAVKANSNLAILHALAQEGAGFDIVSGGELHRGIAAGGDPSKVVFSGVGKSDDELGLALSLSISQINVESREELERLSSLAVAGGKRARIALRVNPDIDAGTHAKITTGLADNKFGIAWEEAAALPLGGLTAWRALMTRARLAPGDRVLITGIGGGVALCALKFAVAAGNEGWVTADDAIPGCQDLCFVTAVRTEDIVEHLQGCGVTVSEGPVERLGALGPTVSVYCHDPDGNLIELSCYAG